MLRLLCHCHLHGYLLHCLILIFQLTLQLGNLLLELSLDLYFIGVELCLELLKLLFICNTIIFGLVFLL